MSWPRVALASAVSIAATLSCAIVERRVEPREGQGGDAASTGPVEPPPGGRRGSGGTKGSGGRNAGGTRDAATDAASDAAGKGGSSGGASSSGGAAVHEWDGAAPGCRRRPGLDGVLLCDDFEAPELHAQWTHFATTGDDGATNLVYGAFPHRGERGLISAKHAQGTRDPLYADVLGGRTAGHLYVRAWMHFPSTARIVDHPEANATLFVLGERDAPYRGCGVAIWRSALTAQCNGVHAGSFAIPESVLPMDQWVCVRYDFPIGADVPASEFRVRVNATTLPNAVTTATTSALNTGYTRLWLGVNHMSEYQTTSFVAYYDDVAVDTRDIACD